MKGPLFYSKILLFGEYGIIKDSKGLSIPYSFYKGALKKDQNPDHAAIDSNLNLRKFVQYLSTLDRSLVTFNLDQLQNDVNGGMYFDSSIPQGYGVGSSGALVAALYDKYAQDKITVLENLTREKLLKLKAIFSGMESFFHGKSSGLDPLNDFLNGDVKSLFSNTKQLSKVVLNHFKPMIPKQFHAIWKKGIETNDYYLKLCGSGGGGYILGFTEDFQAAQTALTDYKLEVVYNF